MGICNLSYSTVEAQSTMVASRLVELPERASGTYSTSAFFRSLHQHTAPIQLMFREEFPLKQQIKYGTTWLLGNFTAIV